MPIRILDPGVIAQIAAGEVVERPASAVKELVENSLDAGASRVSVETRSGGIELLRVTDNGLGIPEAEVELAFERHATSKICGLEDLSSIMTLGFRGEALASIAAAADVELLTRTRSEATGTFIRLSGGKIDFRNKQAREPGTTVTVSALFHRVPARLKFLKSNHTENSHVANVVTQYALAYPEVSFSLVQDGREVLRTPGNGRLADCIVAVYGTAAASDMLEVTTEEIRWNEGNLNTIKVTGMSGAPKVARSSRGYLSFFVNRRWVNSRLLTRAVEDAYQGLLMQDRHPVAVLSITIPPTEVDANVHPTKTEVKFASEGAMFSAVQKAVRRALLRQSPVPKIEEIAASYSGNPVKIPGETAVTGTEGRTYDIFPRAETRAAPAAQGRLDPVPILRIIGQASATYIIAEGENGLYIIDQHAAHERIRYEQILAQKSHQAIDTQGLLEPAVFEVSPAQTDNAATHNDILGGFGFTLEPFGERTYLVRTVPAVLFDRDWRGALTEIIDSFTDGDKTRWEERIIDSIACHSAVRAGQTLSEVEIRELIRQLELANMPRTCPHGRPTMIHLTRVQLEKEFGRTG